MDAKKTDVLNKIFLATFENIKKNLSKKDSYYVKFKTAHSNIKENHPDSQTQDGIQQNLNLLISVLELKISKITEKVLSSLDQIISLGIIENKTLQEKVPLILENLFSKSNIGDDNINYKILNLCLIMYTNKNIRINGISLINLIKICLNVFLLTKNSNCQNASKSTLIQIIDLIIEKVENSFNLINTKSSNNAINNNYFGNFTGKLSKISTSEKDQNSLKNQNNSGGFSGVIKKDSQNEFKTGLLNKNDFSVSLHHRKLTEKYMNFYMDILEIDDFFKNNPTEKMDNTNKENIENPDEILRLNFLKSILEITEKQDEFTITDPEDKISNSSNSMTQNKNKVNSNNVNQNNFSNNPIANFTESKYFQLKILFENMQLDNLKLKNEEQKLIGKYGWCIYCRNQSSFFSEKIFYPICSNECENEMQKLAKSVKIDLVLEAPSESSTIVTDIDYYREDYINTVKILSKLSIKETKQQANVEEINLRLRELCLELIQLLLVKGAKFFKQEIKLLQVIKESTIDSLVKNTMSNEMNIFKLSVNLFLTIISHYREYLKNEIEIFINKVLIAILESENLGYVYKEIILDALLKIADNGNFLVEIYSNYDCDINHKNVFYDIINLMTKIINGLYKKPKYYNTFKNTQEASLRIKCLEFLSNFIKSLSNLVEENNEITNQISSNINSTLKGGYYKSSQSNSNAIVKDHNQTINTDLNAVNQSEYYSQSNCHNFEEDLNISTFENDIKDKISFNLKLKSIISKAIDKFNYKPSASFSYLKAHNLLPTEQIFNDLKKKILHDIEMNDQEKLSEFMNANLTNLQGLDKIDKDTGNLINLFINMNNSLNYLNNIEKEQLQKLTYDDFYSREIAIFLKSNIKEINKVSLGEFLGKVDKEKVLEYFIESYNFKNFHILEAMRLLFSDFNLGGEGQIVDRVVKYFGQKYHKDNPTVFKIPDVAYYLAFSIMLLQTDLHRPEVEKKMSPQVFISNFNLACKDCIEEEVMIDVYNRVLNDPIRFPGQKLYTNKNKKDLIKLEKESILKSTYEELQIKNFGPNSNSIQNPISQDNYNSLNNNYITSIDNDHIHNLLDETWSNFLGIFSQLLADFEEENIVITCIDNILIIGRMCGMIGLETISEAFINTIINITNIMEGREIKKKNFECTKAIIEFSIQSGNYIRSSWFNILTIVSKIDYYHTIGGQYKNEAELFAKEIRRKSKSKNPEREIEIEIKNTETICNNISMLICDNIFSKTATFDLEGITSFISALCLVSKNELDHFFNPRNYSLHKLVEVADFNIFRIQIEWSKIWKLISDHLIFVASNYNHDNICIDAIDSLRQTVTKLLQKPDLMAYNFQIEFFRPFEILFNQSLNRPDRSELILTCLAYIVQNSKNINSGWIVIFNIIKNGMKRKDQKLNGEILKIFQIINDDFTLMNNNNINHEVFRGYIECLCHMYLEDNLKKLAFDTIIKMIAKIFSSKNDDFMNNSNSMEFSNTGKDYEEHRNLSLTGSSNEKKFEFLKIFFYGFDDLLRIDVIEHLNLLFEVISFNKDLIFSSDINSFIYLYFSYFKPHIVSLILNYYEYRLGFFDNQSSTKKENFQEAIELEITRKNSKNKEIIRKSSEFSNTKVFDDFYSKNTLEDIYHNIKTYLENSLNDLIINLEEENNYEMDQNSEKINIKKQKNKNININNKEENLEKFESGEENINEKNVSLSEKTRSNLFELNNNGGGDTKMKIIQFLKQMFKCYDKDTDLILKKLEILKNFDIKNYEISIEFFIEKFFNMIHKNSDTYMNYKFFFEDLLITIFNLTTFNKYPDTLFKIIGKNILFNGSVISDNCWKYLLDNICYKLKSISNIKNNISYENITNIISFFAPFSNLLRDLFVNYFDKLSLFSNKNKGLVNEYHYINLIFCRFLKNDIIQLSDDSETDKVDTDKNIYPSGQIFEILKILSKIKYLILEKTSLETNKFFFRDNIIDLMKLFDNLYLEKKLFDVENSEIIDLIQFEIQQILPRFLDNFLSEDLALIFSVMINFVDSKNSSLRNSAKYIIKQYLSSNLINFIPHKKYQKEESRLNSLDMGNN